MGEATGAIPEDGKLRGRGRDASAAAARLPLIRSPTSFTIAVASRSRAESALVNVTGARPDAPSARTENSRNTTNAALSFLCTQGPRSSAGDAESTGGV